MTNTFGDYLLVLKRIDNKVIVKRTWKKDLDKFPLGSEIINVNGLSTEQYIRDSIAPYIATSTDRDRLDIASGILLQGVPGSTFTIKIKMPTGEEATYTLTHAKANNDIFAPAIGQYPEEKNKGLLEHRTLNDNFDYIGLHSFSNAKIDTLFDNLLPELAKSKGIILDLWYNGGGDDGIAFSILKHFIPDSVLTGSASIIRFHDPFLKAIGQYVTISDTAGNPEKKNAWLLYNGYPVFDKPVIGRSQINHHTQRLTVPVVILTGNNTASAAEDFLIAADNQKHIITMGEPTNGSTGKPYSFNLPGGGSARICVKKDTYPDSREFVGYGIQPDIFVAPTVKDYLENKDVVLEAALKYLKTKRETAVK